MSNEAEGFGPVAFRRPGGQGVPGVRGKDPPRTASPCLRTDRCPSATDRRANQKTHQWSRQAAWPVVGRFVGGNCKLQIAFPEIFPSSGGVGVTSLWPSATRCRVVHPLISVPRASGEIGFMNRVLADEMSPCLPHGGRRTCRTVTSARSRFPC